MNRRSNRRRRPALLVGAACALVALAAGVAHAEGWRGWLVSHGDRVLAEEGADRLFTPASVQKLVVAAAALHHLGPDHQIETVVTARGRLERGVLDGDLVLEAAGDPTWSRVFFPEEPEAPFVALAREVRRHGIVRVEGDLVLELGRFPGRRAPTSRSQAEMGLGFGAPVSGIAVDENAAEIRIAPGRRVGDRASLSSSAPVELRNETVTVTASRHGRGSVEFLPQWGEGVIRVRGEYPASEAAYTVRVSLPAPERVAGERLRDHLAREGVAVRGGVRVATERGPGFGEADAAVVARVFSPPLSRIVEPVLRDSSNWTAEMLVVLVALAATGEGRWDDGVEALGAFLEEAVGLPEDAFSLDDASGLSPENLLSPRAVVALLRFAWRAPWRDAFFAALASPGNGTLEVWPALPQVSAKTGTLKHTTALAGMLGEPFPAPAAVPPATPVVIDADPTAPVTPVVIDADPTVPVTPIVIDATAPEPVFFAVFLNHDLRPRAVQRREIADLLRSWLRLAGPS